MVIAAPSTEANAGTTRGGHCGTSHLPKQGWLLPTPAQEASQLLPPVPLPLWWEGLSLVGSNPDPTGQHFGKCSSPASRPWEPEGSRKVWRWVGADCLTDNLLR